MAIVMTYDIAHAIGMDAGQRHMLQRGGKVWNEADWNTATRAMHKAMPCPDDMNCEICLTLHDRTPDDQSRTAGVDMLPEGEL